MNRTPSTQPWNLPADIDAGILPVVKLLNSKGLHTISSCQGGEGHAWAAPTVRVQPQMPHRAGLAQTADHMARVLIDAGYSGFSLKEVQLYQNTSFPWLPDVMSYVEVEFWSDWEGLKPGE